MKNIFILGLFLLFSVCSFAQKCGFERDVDPFGERDEYVSSYNTLGWHVSCKTRYTNGTYYLYINITTNNSWYIFKGDRIRILTVKGDKLGLEIIKDATLNFVSGYRVYSMKIKPNKEQLEVLSRDPLSHIRVITDEQYGDFKVHEKKFKALSRQLKCMMSNIEKIKSSTKSSH